MTNGRTRQLGDQYVWVSALGLSLILTILFTLIFVILLRGLGFFWASPVELFELDNDRKVLGQVVEQDADHPDGARLRIKVGNRELYDSDFVWLEAKNITSRSVPSETVLLERYEHGNFYGFLSKKNGQWSQLEQQWKRAKKDRDRYDSARQDLKVVNVGIEQIEDRLSQLRWLAKHENRDVSADIEQLQMRLKDRQQAFEERRQQLETIETKLAQYKMSFVTVEGIEHQQYVAEIYRPIRINQMSVYAKMKLYLAKFGELLTQPPRESNTEGGIFPAIFGTVFMVLLMSLFAIPFGVIAAIYLREYAKDGPFVRLVRISVNNLAGVPSIVYGIFGLGFFVYTVGASIDQTFFGYRAPAPTFGTGGILWSSVTLALLTVPVVIVSTEEALAAIPKDVRLGSFALSATKFQTLIRILIPMASPGILTGLILAMARAAGEVAPLMLTGAVKLAPELPLDSIFPYVHLDRKFMHLGFHIYDLAFQSPNVEAVLPMVYVTTALLLGIVIMLSLLAIALRNRMRKKYVSGMF